MCFCAVTGTEYSCASSVTVLWRVFRRKIFLRLLRHCVLSRLLAQNILAPPPTPCFGESSGSKYSCASSVTELWRVFRPAQNILARPPSQYFGVLRVYGRKISLRVLRHGILARLLAQNILAPPMSRYFCASAGAKYFCASSVTCNPASRYGQITISNIINHLHQNVFIMYICICIQR